MIALLWAWRKVIALGAVVICLSLIGWRVSAWHDSHKALPGVQAALDLEVACGEGSQCEARQKALEAAQAAVSQQVVSSYEQELASLRDRPVRVRTVRVCTATATGNVRDADPAGPVDGTGPGTGVVHGSAGPDIGPDLYALAAEADAIAARLRALQSWNKALSTPPVE